MMDLDAIVLATDALSRVRVAGLTACERAVRVAKKAGAVRVLVVEEASALTELAAWRGSSHRPLLVVRADQLVHTGLVLPLIEALPRDRVSVSVVPSDPAVQDLTVGAYAGAIVATGNAVSEIIGALVTGGGDDRAVVEALADANRIPHGEVARAPLRTRDEIKAAHRVLYRILVKPQDNAITRYLYRPVSFPLTRLLVWTRVTPNQISYAVAVLVALGCWFTASASFGNAILGSVIVLAASYLDCCDGEVARVKLLSSRFGAWIDTVVDELSSVGYMVAIGWHCHLQFGPAAFPPMPFDPWKAAIAISTIAMMWCIYCIYYNIIVAVGSANSQDYVGRFEVVPGRQPNTVRLAPVAAKAIAPKQPLPEPLQTLADIAPYIVRRDFISWLAVVLAVSHLTYVAFGMFFFGAIASFVVLTVDHIKLRSLRRSIEREGMSLETP
jgi:phosphatidylglycerophosphate synthase